MMKIDVNVKLSQINERSTANMAKHVGIEFVEIHEDYLTAKMPVDHRTRQPLGMLNGGASAALAETVGSMAAYLSVDRSMYYALGLEIKTNHLRPALDGYVYATASPIHVGKKTQVWKIEAKDEGGNLISFSTLTVAVLPLDERMKEQFQDLFLD